MCLKDVYSIRLNKKDTLIKEYLKQYPVAAQPYIIKDLIIQGIQARQYDIHGIEVTNEKLEEVLYLLRKLQMLEKTQTNSLLKGEGNDELKKRNEIADE